MEEDLCVEVPISPLPEVTTPEKPEKTPNVLNVKFGNNSLTKMRHYENAWEP